MSSPYPPALSTDPVVADLQNKYQALVAELALRPPLPVVAPAPVVAVPAISSGVAADIRKILSDAEGTVTHVHGAAKTLQADIKAHYMVVIALVVAVAAFGMQVLPLLVRVL